MPRLALQLLVRRLERSGFLDQIAGDARELFRGQLRFHPSGTMLPEKCVSVELNVGAVQLGRLSLPSGEKERRDQALRRWLDLVARDLAEHLSSPHGHGHEVLPARISEATRIIRDRHSDRLSLGDVAEAVGLSRERLSRLFHETLGITFSEYLNYARLETARWLLRETELSVTEVAFSSGFQSLSQFHRRFRAAESTSPRLYRQQG